MSARDLSATEFDSLLERDFPQSFSDASHLLRRTVRGEDLFELGGRRRALLMRWFLESRAVKVALRGAPTGRNKPGERWVPDDQVASYDVVGLFLPDRKDYAVLLAPALQELQRRGRRVAVLAENATSVDPRNFPGLEIFDLECWATLGTYFAARATQGHLAGERERLAREFELEPHQRHTVALILRAQAWQQHAFAAALAALQPRVIFGLHLTMSPGIATAIRDRRDSGASTSTVLIQHGVFSGSWEEHDFRGADLVLTWGDYFSDELASFSGPRPPAAVVGHPRLEALARLRSTTPLRSADAEPAASRQYRVLYIGTNGVEADDTAAMQLVADALKPDDGLEVRYLPHPNEPMRKYESAIATRQILPSQVLSGASAYQEVLEADLVLGTQTTMIPESLALGIPAIQVLPERFDVDWHERGMAAASDPEALQKLAHAVLTDPDVRSRLIERAKPLVRRMFGDPLGVTDRVVSLIEAELQLTR